MSKLKYNNLETSVIEGMC